MNIIEYVKKNIKTKAGRKLLILEGVMIAIGISVILIVTPKTITISGHVALLTIAYIIGSLYLIVKNVTDKRLSSNESKE